MTNRHSVIVIGGGQAGLSVSYCLKQEGIDHIVLEKHRIAHTWRTQRWDTFCLVTPNWQCQLPGFPYAGPERHGFMGRDDIVRYIENYAQAFAAPVQEGVAVLKLARDPDSDGYILETSAGTMKTSNVVVAVGGYHRPNIPAVCHRLPGDVVQVHSSEYRKPGQLPEGQVLVIGSGQSGCQIAEDLHIAGRKVHLCVGSAPRVARRYRGKDVVDWLHLMGYYDLPVEKHPLKEGVRTRANHYVTGRDGGRDIDLRLRALEGMKLYGRLESINGPSLTFKHDLAENLNKADEVSESIKSSIDKYIAANGIDAPTEPRYQPLWRPGEQPSRLDLREANVTAVIWSTGFKSDFSWIDLPVFDGRGYPGHYRGTTHAPGLFFIGLPWLHTWGSGRFSGVARDAEHIVQQIVSRRRPQPVAAALWEDSTAEFSELAFGS